MEVLKKIIKIMLLNKNNLQITHYSIILKYVRKKMSYTIINATFYFSYKDEKS